LVPPRAGRKVGLDVTREQINAAIDALSELRNEMAEGGEAEFLSLLETLRGQIRAAETRAQHWQNRAAEIEIQRGHEADEAKRLRAVIASQRDQLARIQEEHSRQAAAWSEERRELKRRIALLTFD
jgi:chromosome segregation ATPase